ncbi:Peroxisomal membrane protein PAS20 [Gonapodya sp. JEL0774]|nr:Peroxisomal membrane protein PAS20 [Gonapodya sp. JEL0774]
MSPWRRRSTFPSSICSRFLPPDHALSDPRLLLRPLMPSPPKPWERNNPNPANVSGPSTTEIAAATAAASPPPPTPEQTALASAGSAPAIPTRPSAGFGQGVTAGASSIAQQQAASTGMTSTFGASALTSPYRFSSYNSYNSSPYSSYSSYSSPYSSYSSPYNRYGGYGSSYGGGYGGYGSSYGGYGGGMGGMYGNRFGANGMDPNNPNGGMNPLMQSTQAAFGVLENVVQAFQGLADMMGSTFHATTSSWMALMAVSEQFGNLRQYLGNALSLMWLWRALRNLLYRVTGRPLPVDSGELNAGEFERFDGAVGAAGSEDPGTSAGRKVFLVFLFFVVAVPWLMNKMVGALARGAREREEKAMEAAASNSALPNSPPPPIPNTSSSISRAKPQVTFARALYPFQSTAPAELALQPGEIVAVMARGSGEQEGWWRGRMRDGRQGWFPANYVEELPERITIGVGSGGAAGAAGGDGGKGGMGGSQGGLSEGGKVLN